MLRPAGVRIPSGWRSHDRLQGRGDPAVRRPHMPHLYLPTDHTDADLVLAADVASAVSSADLYVTWTLDSGPGSPEVEAVVREEREADVNPFAEVVVALMQGVVALWQLLTGPSAPQETQRRRLAEGGHPAGEPTV